MTDNWIELNHFRCSTTSIFIVNDFSAHDVVISLNLKLLHEILKFCQKPISMAILCQIVRHFSMVFFYRLGTTEIEILSVPFRPVQLRTRIQRLVSLFATSTVFILIQNKFYRVFGGSKVVGCKLGWYKV